jgi:hypothetical protein
VGHRVGRVGGEEAVVLLGPGERLACLDRGLHVAQAGDPSDHRAVGPEDGAPGEARPPVAAVGEPDAQLAVHRAPPVHGRQALGPELTVVGVDEVGRGMPDHVGGRPAEVVLGAGRHPLDHAVRVGLDDGVGHVLGEHPEALLGGGELVAGLDLGGDVAEDAEDLAHAPVGPEHGPDAHRGPDALAVGPHHAPLEGLGLTGDDPGDRPGDGLDVLGVGHLDRVAPDDLVDRVPDHLDRGRRGPGDAPVAVRGEEEVRAELDELPAEVVVQGIRVGSRDRARHRPWLPRRGR